MHQYLLSQFGPMAEPIAAMIAQGAAKNMSDEDFIVTEIMHWADSPPRKVQIDGARYYRGEHDILLRQREVIGPGGHLHRVDNLPNNQIVDNQYAKMVDQKINYLMGKPFSFKADDAAYLAVLNDVFDKNTKRLFHGIARDCLNGGIAWVHPYYDSEGNFKFQRFPPYEILPFWKDAEHTILDIAIRLYSTIAYEGRAEKIVQHVEIYSTQGIQRYIYDGGRLLPDADQLSTSHAAIVHADKTAQPLNWERVPLVAFKYNEKEISLIRMVRSLQDALNATRSDWQNRTQEDMRNTILVIKNYDGADLGEFRRMLSLYGAIKVNSSKDAEGGIETLQIDVNSENFELIIKAIKRALIENARGFDAKDDRMGGNPNEMNLRSAYSDIDLDADGMEMQFQAAFDQLLWFVDKYLQNKGLGNFESNEVTLTFDRNMIVNDSQTITDIKNSVGIISDETLIAKHPFVSDPQAELERKKKETQEQADEMNQYGGAFKPGTAPPKQGNGGGANEA